MTGNQSSHGDSAESVRLREQAVGLRQSGRLEESIALLRTALQAGGRDASVWCELAHGLRWAGHLSEARAAAERALELLPQHAPTWFNLGAVLVEQQQVEQGIAAYRHALELRPDFPEAWSNLGLALDATGQRKDAINAFHRALDANPELAPVWNNLGGALLADDRFAEAINAYRRAVDIAPDYAEAWSNLADGLCRAGDFVAAIEASDHALQIEPALAAAWHNRGAAYAGGGDFAAACKAFRRALELDTQSAQSWSALGSALLRQGLNADAVAAQQRAVELVPQDFRNWRNLAHAQWVNGEWVDAIEALRRALALRPDHAGMRGDLVFQLMAVCDWRDLDRQIALLAGSNADTPRGEEETPHANLFHCDDEATNLAVARRWADNLSRAYAPAFAAGRGDRGNGPITIGYLSSDLHDHATAYLMRGVFQHHDHRRFRVHTYSYGPDDASPVRADIRQASDLFRDIRALGHREAAAQIHADGVDILIDLKGWTQGARLEICALRPAPVQMTYIGFPGSSGADFIDYALVDAIVVPPASESYYTERLIRLPNSYQANDDGQPIADDRYTRAEFGLPEDAPVFCSFNACQKLDPQTFTAWMRILKRVPGAVLWQFASNRWAVDNLAAAAGKNGVDPARIVFARGLPRAQHLRRLQLADIALDTRVCNGHTTTSDALWAGVPVLTQRGRHFASRVSASCLSAIGMPELVTGTLDEYEEAAVRLATDRNHLRATRARLLANRDTQPLFDTVRFTRNLERAYLMAWQRHCAGQRPESFSVSED